MTDVDAIIATARKNGLPRGEPRGLSSEALAALRLPEGSEVPADVKAWLAFSAGFPALFSSLDPPRWAETTARAFVEAEIAEVVEELAAVELDEPFDPDEAIERTLDCVPDEVRDVAWVRLEDSASQAWFVALTGLMPVLAYEKEEFWIADASFLGYVARRVG